MEKDGCVAPRDNGNGRSVRNVLEAATRSMSRRVVDEMTPEKKAALKACGQRFAFVNILEDPELRQGLKDYSNWPTFPQLYVGGELVGGCDIAIEMYESGELKTLLEGVAA